MQRSGRKPTSFPLAGGLSTVTAKPARSFVDSIGVCTHMHYNDTAYNDGSRLQDMLVNLGVRHVRDGIVAGRPDVYATAQSIHTAGISFLYGIGDPKATDVTASVITGISYLKDSTKYGGTAEGVEMPDEFDGFSGLVYPQWSDKLYAFMQTAYPLVKADATLGSLPYVGPSFGTYNGRSLFAGNASYDDALNYFDAGNLHAYPGGRFAETNMPGSITDMQTVSGGKPLWATETGYHTAIHYANSGHYGVNEMAQAIYHQRLLLEYFRQGIVRTYLYQLLDQKPQDPGLTNPEEHFGLVAVEGDGTAAVSSWTLRPKASFVAIKNLIAVLDDATIASAGSLPYALGNSQGSIRQLLLGRSDGSFDLVLWNAQAVYRDAVYVPYDGYIRPQAYNGGTSYPAGSTAHNGDEDVENAKYNNASDGGPVTPAAQPVVLTLASVASVKTVVPLQSQAFTILGSAKRFLIPVGPTPVVVRITL